MISSVYPTYKDSYKASTLQSFYKGNKSIYPSLSSHKQPFSIDKAKSFFSNFLNIKKLPELISDFGITVSDASFDMFCTACAMQLKEFCTSFSEDAVDVMNSTCVSLRKDSSYIGNKRVMPSDYELINEVNNLCPICRKQHLTLLDGITVRNNYNITLIYPYGIETDNPSLATIFQTYYPAPKHINEFDNEIATCLTCHNNYKLNPTTELYRKLKEKKLSLKKERELTDALKIKEKIPEDDVNYDEIVLRVVKHYNFIDSLMREYEAKTTDGSTKLGQEIKEISDKLIAAGKGITEVLEEIAKDILRKTTNKEADLPYCKIIVAYFVQNCEVLTRWNYLANL